MSKIKLQKTGYYTLFTKLFPSGMYQVTLYSPTSSILDTIRCDQYKTALEYLRAFNKIAKVSY